jgi:drug/metabolite transporter (DMT)-like permease
MSQKQPALSVAILLILAFIWGSSFILMKEGLKSFTSFQVAAYRLSIAGFFFLPVFLKHIRKVDKKDFGILFISGLTGSGRPKEQTRARQGDQAGDRGTFFVSNPG